MTPGRTAAAAVEKHHSGLLTQAEQPDSEYTYELFSVIIHKGGCYGGHYHVYIKDIDELGHWEMPVRLRTLGKGRRPSNRL